MPKWVMVHSDGRTYTELDGCAIVAVPDEMPDDEVQAFVNQADGWYCFNDTPPGELVSNNNFTNRQLLDQDLEYWRENWQRLESRNRGL